MLLFKEIQWLKQDCGMIRNAVLLLEQEKDNLRQAVRKLKVCFLLCYLTSVA